MKRSRRDNDAVAKPIDVSKVKLKNIPWTDEEMERERQLNKQKEMLLKSKRKES